MGSLVCNRARIQKPARSQFIAQILKCIRLCKSSDTVMASVQRCVGEGMSGTFQTFREKMSNHRKAKQKPILHQFTFLTGALRWKDPHCWLYRGVNRH